MAGGREWGVAT